LLDLIKQDLTLVCLYDFIKKFRKSKLMIKSNLERSIR